MKNAIVLLLIGVVILVGGITMVNHLAEQYTTIKADVTRVNYEYNGDARVYYSYVHPVDGDLVTGYVWYEVDELTFGLYILPTVDVTVDRDTMRPSETTTFKEKPFRLAVYGFGGFFLLAGIAHIFLPKRNA